MRLRSKNLTGVVQPLPYVDQFLSQQGFTKMDDGSSLTYYATIYDSSTSNSYYLSIPTFITSLSCSPHQPAVKMGFPRLQKKPRYGGDQEQMIPLAVIQAAEHKLAEIADYLTRVNRDQVRS